MLILLIRFHCKICPLPNNTISRVCILRNRQTHCIVGNVHILQQELISKINILQCWDKKVSLYIHVVVLQSGLPSLDDKLERFVTKKWKKRLPNLSQTREIHPLDPQPHRHSMLAPRVCAPRVTRWRLGKYWWRDFFRKRLAGCWMESRHAQLVSRLVCYMRTDAPSVLAGARLVRPKHTSEF